jgi:predicted nuclease of predicted toxin-antitoxin system
MNLRQFAFLADENIHPDVTAYWRGHGLDIVSVKEVGLMASDDVVILRRAKAENRLVLTMTAISAL